MNIVALNWLKNFVVSQSGNVFESAIFRQLSAAIFRFSFNMGGVEKTTIYAKNLNGCLNCRTNL